MVIRNVKEQPSVTVKANFSKGRFTYNDGIAYLNFDYHTADNLVKAEYKISPDLEYEGFPTGASSLKGNDGNGCLGTCLYLDREQARGSLDIDVKLIDADNKEYGPFHFNFDMDSERERITFENAKSSVLHSLSPWIDFWTREYTGDKGVKYDTTAVVLQSSILDGTQLGDKLGVLRGCLTKIAYGINKKIPDTEITYEKAAEKWNLPKAVPERYLYYIDKRNSSDDVKFVSCQLFFSDGTSSDVKIFKTRGYSNSEQFTSLSP